MGFMTTVQQQIDLLSTHPDKSVLSPHNVGLSVAD